MHDLLPRLADTLAADTEIAAVADRRYRSVSGEPCPSEFLWGRADYRSEERR
jgi:hypothetical protein